MAARLSAKDIQYDRPGSVAAYYGWNDRNIDAQIQAALAGPKKNAANVRQHIDKYLSKRNVALDTADANQRIAALDYAHREEARKQQTKGSFFDKIAGFIGPAVGILTGNPWLGALAGATSNVAAGKGLKGAAIGAVSGGASGYFSPGVGSILKGGSGAAAGASGASTGLSYGGNVVAAAGKLGTIPAGLSPAAFASTPGIGLATSGLGAGILSAAKAANTASGAKSVWDTVKNNGGTLASGASALASIIGAKAGAASVKSTPPAPRAAAPVSTASSKVVDINDARVRKAALDQTAAASDGFGFDDTKNTGARGILTPARTRKKQLLGA